MQECIIIVKCIGITPRWRRKWQPTPEFMPRESCGQMSLVGCFPWGSHRVGHDWSVFTSKQASKQAMHHIHIHREKPWSQLMQRGQFKNFKIFSWFKKKKKTWQITLQGNYHLKVKVPDGPAVKNLPAKQEMQETEVQSLVRKIRERTKHQPTPLFLTRESHGQRSLVGYSAKGREELDTTD